MEPSAPFSCQSVECLQSLQVYWGLGVGFFVAIFQIYHFNGLASQGVTTILEVFYFAITDERVASDLPIGAG